MSEATVMTIKGKKVVLKQEGAFGNHKTRVRGEIILPSDGEKYNDAHNIWNAMIDWKPGIIIVCKGNADYVQCNKFAKEYLLVVTVRGGGHNIAGKCFANDAMLINLSEWCRVNVNPAKQIANISPGSTLGDIDHC
jgi:FAD/FMN-containing dehydrogenase